MIALIDHFMTLRKHRSAFYILRNEAIVQIIIKISLTSQKSVIECGLLLNWGILQGDKISCLNTNNFLTKHRGTKVMLEITFQ